MLPRNIVHYENTGMIVNDASLQPDILITGADRAPVVIEAEFEPARNVEREASDRLGLLETDGNRDIESAIALRYPRTLRTVQNIGSGLSGAELTYAILHQDGSRFPKTGWLKGSCQDIADVVRLSTVPQSAVNEAVKRLELGIDTAAKRLDEIAELRPRIADSIARLLGLSNVVQTRRMACAIVANAMIFHDRVAGLHDEVKPLHLVCGDDVINPQSELSSAWQAILKINYWPIFAVARDIVNQLHPSDCRRILRILQQTAYDVSATGVGVSHDLTGRIFQSLIADRKYLATFYTLPASAALLTRLAVDKLRGVDWSDAEGLGELRIADFACGTGALLAAVYEQIATRHENAGGDAENLHKAMMEEVLYGFDVMPSAIHISGATLSGVHPNVKFGGSRLYNMPYGKQRDGTVAIGSLEFLHSSAVMSQINTNDPALRTGSTGEETAMNVIADARDESFDVVIMNPPFTRATNHEGAHADVTNPAFAAFGASRADQTAMGSRINRLGRGTCYHGNAGIASAFAALAHRKLKKNGVLALVLPLSAAGGTSWKRFRQMMADSYNDVSIHSIASIGRGMAFSSDTGIAEILVVGRKISERRYSDVIDFSSLAVRPHGIATSSVIASAISGLGSKRSVKDGPYGGTPIRLGDEHVGEVLTQPTAESYEIWSCVRVADYSLAQVAHSLARSRLELPGLTGVGHLPVLPLGELAKIGPVDRDITGPIPRGAFDKSIWRENATYPAIWSHDARHEKQLVCKPDSQLIVRPNMEWKADEIWQTASRSHLNSEFTFGSQALSCAFTDEISIGGRVWPSVIFDDDKYDYAFSLWSNSTLGLLLHWWQSSRQQSSKATLKITAAPSLPVLDFRSLSDKQHEIAKEVFSKFRDLVLEPAYIGDSDLNRRLLDQRIICDILGFDNDTFSAVRRVTAKWCAEPSVHGGKARPASSALRV